MHVSKVDIVKLLSQLLEEFYPSFKDKNLSRGAEQCPRQGYRQTKSSGAPF